MMNNFVNPGFTKHPCINVSFNLIICWFTDSENTKIFSRIRCIPKIFLKS